MRARAKATAMENEVRMFWRATQELKRAVALGEDVTDYVDELDVLRQMTDSPALKERCTETMLRYAGRNYARRMRS